MANSNGQPRLSFVQLGVALGVGRGGAIGFGHGEHGDAQLLRVTFGTIAQL